MKTIIRLTESDLHRIIRNAVKTALREGAYDKYQKDLVDIDLDSLQDDMNMAYAYSHMNDPMIKNVKGSTIRNMLSPDMGNELYDSSGTYSDVDPIGQEKITNDFLNTPNASRNFKKFPRKSRVGGGVRNYDSLANGSKRINDYKQRMGV